MSTGRQQSTSSALHLIGLRRPLYFSQGRKQALLFWGGGGVVSLVPCLGLPADEKSTPCHPGQGSTLPDFGPLRQSLVVSICVQTDALPLAIKPTHTAQPTPGMPKELFFAKIT